MSRRSEYIDQEVGKLLGQYQQYKQLLADQQVLSSKLAKQKLQGDINSADENLYTKLASQLQELSDSMTFASPTIWMRYKYEAYKDESQPIKTMHDFRVHCSKPGYICTKRFLFVNEQLGCRDLTLLTDNAGYKDDVSLGEVLNEDIFAVLESDDTFMDVWKEYEYHKADGRVAKWENFTKVSSPS